jgi:hypothetical protein
VGRLVWTYAIFESKFLHHSKICKIETSFSQSTAM